MYSLSAVLSNFVKNGKTNFSNWSNFCSYSSRVSVFSEMTLLYSASDTGELIGKKAIMGALTLYLDFINLFIMLLRLFGQRR